MYSKDYVAAMKEKFWTAFGQYMALHLSADGEKINWINYKTGIRFLSFRKSADNKQAIVMIELSHPDAGMRDLMLEQFKAIKHILEDTLGESWIWQQNIQNEHDKLVTRIYTKLENVSLYKEEHWPAIISFLKPRVIALDEFWSNARHLFDDFR